jgi:hypothetical protein
MTKVNFAEARKEAQKKGLLGKGDYLKLQEGANKVRLMSECLGHPGEFNGRPTFKWLCYVLDREDGKIKPFFMADKIYKQIQALQTDPEYAFDEVPMPYDITINAEGAGTKEVTYVVTAARQNTPLTPAEKALLRGMKPIQELQDALSAERQNAGTAAAQKVEDDDGPPIGPEDMPD